MLKTMQIRNIRFLQRTLGCSLILLCFFSREVWAQGTKNSESGYNEKVMVVAPYQPSLSATHKPGLSLGQMQETGGKRDSITYGIISRPATTHYPIENIKPAKVTGEPIEKLFNQHIKLGFGTHLAPLAEVYLAMGRSQQYGFSASYKHHSSYGTVKGYDQFKTDNSFNEGDLSGEIFATKFKVRLDLAYRQTRVNCYGLANAMYDSIGKLLLTNSEFNKNEKAYKTNPVRWYQNMSGTLRFDDRVKDPNQWRYDASLYYNFGRSNWRSMENIIEVDGGVSKRILSKKARVDYLDVGARVSFGDYMHRSHIDNPLQNSYIFKVEPTVSYRYGIWELDGGLRFYVYGDPIVGNKVQFNPVARLNVHAVPNVLNVFVGMDGNVQRNTLTSIFAVNPYLHPLDPADFTFSRDKFFFYAGIKSSFSRNIDFVLTASTHWLSNYMSFDYYRYEYPTSSVGVGRVGYNDFKPVYTPSVFNFKLKGELNLRWEERIFGHVEATYNFYNKNIAYTPAFEGKIMFRYNIGNKFIVTSEIRGYTNMKAFDRYGEELTIKGGFDWSAGLEYRFFKRWSAFVNLNNIIAQRYYKWHDYPSYRFDLMAGLTFSF